MRLSSYELKALKSYAQAALKAGATYCTIIPASKVVTSEWVRLKCQFGCDAYGKRRTCPPLSPSPSTTHRMLKDFSGAIFIAFRVPNAQVERRLRRKGRKLLASLERDLFLDGYYSAFAMGFGPCNLCPTCDLSSRCKHPEIARPSMEACGIDVYATSRAAGFPLKVVRTYEEGCSLCGLVLFGERDSRSSAASRGFSTPPADSHRFPTVSAARRGFSAPSASSRRSSTVPHDSAHASRIRSVSSRNSAKSGTSAARKKEKGNE